MKRFQLLSILILLISFVGVQSVVGEEIEGNGPSANGTTGYYTTTAYTEDNDYFEVQDEYSIKHNLDIKLEYPSNKVTFDAWAQRASSDFFGGEIKIAIDQYINGWKEDYSNKTNKLTNNSWTNGINKTISEQATKISFVSLGGTLGRRVRKIYVHMTPHILLSDITLPGKADNESKKIGDDTSTATSTKTATINFGSMLNNAETKTATIKIKSGLASSSWSTTLSDSPEGFSFTGGVSSSDDKFIAIGNQKDITVTFNPQGAGVTAETGSKTISETITISGAGTGNDVVITLTATVNPPQTQEIEWNQTEFNKTLRVGDEITLNATATSNLGVTYKSNNDNATISGKQMTIVKPGPISITASQNGDANFAAAEDVTKDGLTAYEYNVSNLQKEIGYNYAKLSWDNIHGADSYNIEPLGKSTTGINYTIANLTHNTTYTYKIKTNDAQSIHTQSSGTDVSIKTLPYPVVSGISTNAQQNQATISWTGVSLVNNSHSLVQYRVLLYKNDAIVDRKTSKTPSITLTNLVDATSYKVKIGVEYQYTLDGTQYPSVSPDESKAEQWATSDVFNTTSYIPTKGYDGVIIYQGEWHRVMVNDKKIVAQSGNDGSFTKDLEYPCVNLKYEAWLNEDGSDDHTLIVDETKESLDLASGNGYTNNNRYKSEKEFDNTINKVTFKGEYNGWGTGRKTIYIDNIYAKIAPHIILNTPKTIYLDNVEIGSTEKVTVDFKSFLTKRDLVATTSNKDFFLIDGTLESKTIATGANVLEKTTDNTTFTVVFNAKELGEKQTTITITDGTSTETITITGKCIKKTPIITWTKYRQMNIGATIANAATSTCGTEITYTTDNSEVIDVIDNKLVLVAKGINKANITATTAGNDTYASIESTIEFEVTDKTLQEIVWNQSFYNLKIGGSDITLDAHTINKATGIANNLPITYSTANNSVVSITDGVLHIEGLGQTTITATQAGNDEYAALSKTMTVYVRPDYDDCSGEYVFADNETYTKGDATWGGFTRSTIEKEYTLTTVGDKLSFTASASAGGLTTGNGLKVTDQDGNEIFSRSANQIEGIQNLQLARSVKSLKFYINGNFQISLSNIYVTQAVYLEKEQNTISFPETMAGKTGNASISFDWANQPDVMYAAIIEDEHGVFSVEENTEIAGTYIFGGSCGDAGTNTIRLFFNPTTSGDYSAKLAVYVGETTKAKEIVTLTAKSIKQPQFITWDQELNPVQGGKYDLTATTTSSLPITYTSSDENIARIEDGKLVILGAGSVSITASQSGNEAYETAGSVTKTFTIAKLDQTITWNQDFPSGLIIGSTMTLEATATSGEAVIFKSSNEAVAIVVGNQLTITGIGTATITASQPGNNNYNPAPEVTKTLNIVKLDQTITWNQTQFDNVLRIGDVITLNAYTSSGLNVTYSSSNQDVANVTGNTLTIIGAGENITISASQSGSANYNSAETISKTIATYQYNVSNISTEIGYNYVKLTWDAIEGADSYTIFDGATLVGTTTETNITITGLDHASTHTYTIKTNDADSYTQQSSGSTITITTLSYPKTDAGNVTTVNVNDFTIQWNQVTPALNHELIEYIIRLYKENESNYTEYSSTNTSYTISGLIDHTQYTVYIGVRYRQNLDNAEFTPTKDNDWYKIDVSTPSIITSEPHDGVQMDKGVWYRVNLNNKIDISDGSAGSGFETKQNPYIMSLNYPCENNFKYKFSASDFADTWGTATLRIQESTNESKDTPSWIPITNNNPKEVHKEDEDGTASTSNGANVKRLEFYENTGSDGKANGKAYISDIWVEIVPHILLKETRYVKEFTNETATQTTNAIIDFGTIEIGSSKAVTIDFKSFLSKGNIRAELTNNTNKEIFWLNSIRGTTVLPIAENNTLKQINTDDHKFTISFNPDRANDRNNPNDYFEGTLIIHDEQHTVTITLKGKCIKKTPEISWINDKYINLGDFLAGAATSTYGSVTYTSNDSDIIGVNGSLLEGKAVGDTTIIASVAETSTYYAATTEPTTFYVTDRILQAIEWNQDFTSLTTDTENINLTAQSIVRETNEYSNNPITYSSADSTIVEIVDGNKLKVNNSGYTTITAHQEGNDEYAPTYMTKIVFIRNASGGCTDLLNNITEKQYGDVEDGAIWDAIVGGWDWGPFTFEQEWNTVADKLSFTTSKHSSSTSHHLTITDDLGNIVYDDELGKSVTDLQLDRNARKLTFELKGNLRVAISDIEITPAIYIESETNEINFSSTEVDLIAIEEVSFNWANQPDYIWVKIVDDTEGVFSVDNKTAIFGSTNCGDYGTSTVKVLFSPKEQKNDYSAKLAVYVDANLDEPALEIPITGIGAKAKQEISWINSSPSTVDNHINLARTTASRQQPITYTLESGDNIVRFNDDNTITILNEGTFILSAQQEGNNSYEPTNTITKEFTATIGTIQFDKDGEWSSVNNWKPVSVLNRLRNVLPSAVVNTEIVADAAMTDVDGVVNNLSIVDGGTLTIGATSGLKANEVSGATATNLILEASENGNAAFAYVSGAPSATVKMHSKASGGVAGGTPQWQYMGVAVANATTSDFPNAWLLKWEEKDNITGDPWSKKPLAGATTLVPWAGYSITQRDTTTYTMSGQLMNSNQTYQLTRTIKEGADKQDPDCGFNLLANSYTAPIDITKLKTTDFSEKADACIVLYNTGTYADWDSLQGKSGEAPGQLTVIPVESAKAISEEQGLPTTIPSMQAFFVMAREDGATFTVDYQRAVAGATNHGNQMRAPEAQDEFNVLKIMIEGENSRDRLFLLENEKTTKAYDNGYEARKIFDAPRGHQMYATCQYGYASIDCSESFVGQTIGLKGDSEGEQLTISFDTDRLKDYSSLYLYDKVTGDYVNIIAGEEYTFYGIRGANDNRFTIVTNPDDRNQTPPFVVIGNELAFDKSQIGTDNANIYIYDAVGRLLMTDKVNPGENYRIPDMPEGIYLVSFNGYTTKIVRK